MFDVLITNGTVVDGTGAESFRADIGITGRRIESIGNLSDSTAKHIIDATNLTISPGFIDTHVHCDGALLMDPAFATDVLVWEKWTLTPDLRPISKASGMPPPPMARSVLTSRR